MTTFIFFIVAVLIAKVSFKRIKFEVLSIWLQGHARTIINGDYVIIDTETTGINETSQILEIAIIDMEGKVLLNTLVNPTSRISSRATEVHGIRKQDLKDSPRWDTVYAQLNEIIGDRKIVTYNAKFDERLINQSCAAFEIEPVERTFSCVMLMYAE